MVIKHQLRFVLIAFFSVLFLLSGAFAQNVVNGEYFFDTDPGIENGEPISFTPAGDIANHNESIDISTLSIGAHQLFIRTQDDNGQWAQTTVHNFAILQNPTNAQITALEYFYDVDPGEANGTNIPITASVDIPDFSTTLSTSGISTGFHTLFFRSKDVNGNWSLSSQHLIYKNTSSNPVITDIEYFFDNDPGEGNANNITITQGAEIADLMPNINTDVLSSGTHFLGIRSKDNLGQWSHLNYFLFLKTDNPSVSQITELEYFFDNDPGTGNANSINITPGADISNITSTIVTSGLSQGAHFLSIRSKDNFGRWSHLNSFLILKQSDQVPSQITDLEYYLGNDPGVGNGNAISITPSANIVNLSTSISTLGLSSGTYALNLRSKDNFNNWSHVSSALFFYTGSGPITDIVEIEYYFGLDPGKGNATSIPITPETDIVNLTTSINTSSIQNGANVLNIRSKSADDKWSNTNQFLVLKRPSAQIDLAKIEYYFDQDPGKGNGTEIALSASTEISDLSSMIDISALPLGPHLLSFRTQEVAGEWSLDQHFLILKQPEDIPYNINAAEYFVGDDPGQGNGIALTVNPGNQIFLIQTIDVSTFDEGAQEIHVRTKDETGRWSHDQVFPIKKRAFEAKNITKGEYFFDTDPGLNLATSFTIPASVDVANLNVIVMTNGLSEGLHDLYIRTVEEDNKWSLTNVSIDILVDQALPLIWLDFELLKKENSVLLDWKVAEAKNTSHFNIEKKKNEYFDKIGEVESFNQVGARDYKFTDNNPHNGWNYYRISQNDIDGNRSYSDTKSVFFSNILELSVFPNPTTETIHISGVNANTEYKYSILDASNKQVKSGTYTADMLLDFQDLPDGPYFLLLESNIEIESFLIIKQ